MYYTLYSFIFIYRPSLSLDLFNRVQTTQVTASHKLKDRLFLLAHRLHIDLSEESRELYFLKGLVFVEIESHQKVLGATLTAAVGPGLL